MEEDIFSIDANGNLIVTTCVDYFDINNDKKLDDYEKICDYVSDLPNITSFDRIRTDTGDFSDWDDYAKKGIAAYDNYYGNNPILTSKPTTPLTISDIPEDILVLLKEY